MDTIVLKLVLTPTLIGVASGVGRRWGPDVSGWIVGLPLTTGPIALFLSLEYGPAFAARAAYGIILGLVSVALFYLTYGRLALWLSWLPATLLGWAVFFAATFALQRLTLSVVPTFIGVVVVLAGVLKLLPNTDLPRVAARLPQWDIPARMIVATSLVLLLTAMAGLLGPRLSGLLAPFPIFGTVLVAFTHRFEGATAARYLLRGIVIGSFSFAACFLVVCLMIESASATLTFGCATMATLALHGTSWWFLKIDRIAH